MKELDINVATEFMVLAAALIEIKSKMLLPKMKTEGDELSQEDPRTELVEKILNIKGLNVRQNFLSNRKKNQ